jgi:hypothetical protein
VNIDETLTPENWILLARPHFSGSLLGDFAEKSKARHLIFLDAI